MSKVAEITSSTQFQTLLTSTTYVVADFYADWCPPCKAIAPLYGQLATSQSAAGKLAFVKVNVDNQQGIATTYGVTAMPTFIIFKNGKVVESIRGANPPVLRTTVQKIVEELAKEPVIQKPTQATESAAPPVREESGEEETVSGGYSMTAGTNWRMAL